MLEMIAPHGARFNVPAVPAEDVAPYPSFNGDLSGLRGYYDDEGYAVVRDVFSSEVCDAMRATFEREVKPYDGWIYRQTSSLAEQHRFSPQGKMMNSILNIHAVDPRFFPSFRRQGIELITSKPMQKLASILMGEPAKIVQSMYFEGNPATWAHQDTYYLDSEEIGRMVGAWIALEDIAPGAGRFYIYPKSHKLAFPKNSGAMNYGTNHEAYKKYTLDMIREHAFECRAPALKKGDVLFWHACTIHGSMTTTTPDLSRSSVTAHYIPASKRFLQFQSRIKPLNITRVNGIDMHTPKDLAKLSSRALLEVEARFPNAFRYLKHRAIAVMTRKPG